MIELGAALWHRIGDIKLAVLAIVGMEGEPEQTALIEKVVQLRHSWPNVQERLGQQTSLIVDNADLTLLLDQGHATATVWDRYHRQGMRQPPSHFLQFDL